MNLYKINFRHYAPCGSSEVGLKYFLIAEDDRSVFHWMKLNVPCGWEDIKTREEIERKILLKGDLEEEDLKLDGNDTFYGVTLYGWEQVDGDLTGLDSFVSFCMGKDLIYVAKEIDIKLF